MRIRATAAMGALLWILPAFAAYGGSYELQEKCARDAREWFDRQWQDDAQPPFTVQYTNHYSQKFGTCFAVVSRTGVLPRELLQYTHFLYDVLENREIGRVNWFDKAGRVSTNVCFVNGKPCSSLADWNELVKPYTED